MSGRRRSEKKLRLQQGREEETQMAHNEEREKENERKG